MGRVRVANIFEKRGRVYISSLRTLQVHNIMSTKALRYLHLIVKCFFIAIVIDTQDHHCLYQHRHPIFPIFPISCDPLSRLMSRQKRTDSSSSQVCGVKSKKENLKREFSILTIIQFEIGLLIMNYHHYHQFQYLAAMRDTRRFE